MTTDNRPKKTPEEKEHERLKKLIKEAFDEDDAHMGNSKKPIFSAEPFDADPENLWDGTYERPAEDEVPEYRLGRDLHEHVSHDELGVVTDDPIKPENRSNLRDPEVARLHMQRARKVREEPIRRYKFAGGGKLQQLKARPRKG